MTGRLPLGTMGLPPTALTVEEIASLLGPGRRRGTERMARVLVLRYGTEPVPTLTEVGGVLAVSRERVAQLERMALRLLAHPTNAGPVLAAAGTETRLGAAVLDRRRHAAEVLAWWGARDADAG